MNHSFPHRRAADVDSGLRVAAGVPNVADAPFGLGALGCFIVAAVFVLLALLAWRAPRLAARRGGGDDEIATDDEATLQTLAESVGVPADSDEVAVTHSPSTAVATPAATAERSKEHTSELQSLMRN